MPLPQLDDAERKQLLAAYNNLITQLSLQNQNRKSWWYTWLSCRDQINNDLLKHLHFVERIKKCLRNNSTPESLTVCCSSPALVKTISATARNAGWKVVIGPIDRLLFLASVIRLLPIPPIDGIKILVHGLRLVIASRIYPLDQKNRQQRTVALVSNFHDSITQQGNVFRDLYFGELGTWLESQNEKVIYMGLPQGNIRSIASKCRDFTEYPVMTIGHVLNFGQVISAAFFALFSRIKIRPKADSFPQLSGLIHESLNRAVIHKGFGLMMERATKQLLDKYPNARVVHIYENNPWERGVDIAAKNRPDPRDVTGYLHCAVLPTHLKNTIGPEEIPIRPGPDRIVCTGSAAREVFLELGPHHPERVFAGCNLRGPDFSTLPLRSAPPSRIRNVLVILEGLPKMVRLLRFVAAASTHVKNIKFDIRAHPVLPLADLAKKADVTYGPDLSLRENTNDSLESAISEADAVLYQGSTGVLSAAYEGVPLICFDAQELLPADPLYKCSALKEIVKRPIEIINAIENLESMDKQTYFEQSSVLRSYIKKYSTSSSFEQLKNFRLKESISCNDSQALQQNISSH